MTDENTGTEETKVDESHLPVEWRTSEFEGLTAEVNPDTGELEIGTAVSTEDDDAPDGDDVVDDTQADDNDDSNTPDDDNDSDDDDDGDGADADAGGNDDPLIVAETRYRELQSFKDKQLGEAADMVMELQTTVARLEGEIAGRGKRDSSSSEDTNLDDLDQPDTDRSDIQRQIDEGITKALQGIDLPAVQTAMEDRALVLELTAFREAHPEVDYPANAALKNAAAQLLNKDAELSFEDAFATAVELFGKPNMDPNVQPKGGKVTPSVGKPEVADEERKRLRDKAQRLKRPVSVSGDEDHTTDSEEVNDVGDAIRAGMREVASGS